jgi:GTPase SAR1 family protein
LVIFWNSHDGQTSIGDQTARLGDQQGFVFAGEIKVVVVGNGGVGKTSMIRRFCKGQYTDEYKKTIGVDFLEKKQ